MTKRRGRGEHSIYQRKDGREKSWVLSVSTGTVNGKRRRVAYYFATKREAQQKLRELSKQSNAPNAITVAKYQKLWLGDMEQSVAPETYTSYCKVATDIDKHIGKARLQSLDARHIRQFYADMRKSGVSVSGQNRAGGQLRRVLRQAVRERIISFNAAELVSLPSVEKHEFQPLTKEQVVAFLSEAERDRLYALFVTAIHTGARSGELFALQWSDIDFERQQMSISKTLEELNGQLRPKSPKTATSRRKVSLSSSLIDVLQDHRKEMMLEGNHRGPVFCNTRGNYLRRNNVRARHFQPIAERAGVLKRDGQPALRFHDLRHQAASIWLSLGVNIKIVSTRLGHKTIKITLDFYSHLMPDDQQMVADRLDEYFADEQAANRLSEGNPAKNSSA